MSALILTVIVLLLLGCGLTCALWRRETALRGEMAVQNRRLTQELSETCKNAEHFRTASEHANDGIVIQSMDGIIIWANPAYGRMMGLTTDEIIGRNPLSFALRDDNTPSDKEIARFRYVAEDVKSGKMHVFENKRGDGTLFWNQISTSLHISPSGVETVVLVCRDITQQILKEQELKQTSKRLAHLANHDGLTGAANAAVLSKFINEALRFRQADALRIGVLHLDMDKFKQINDTHGHAAGDAALQHVTTQIRTALRKSDMIARVGGDEFVIACPGLTNMDALQKIGAIILEAVKTPLQWNDRQIQCRLSIGASLSTSVTTDASELLHQSDFALYNAKRRGGGFLAPYDRALERRHTKEQTLASDLRHAIKNGRITFAFAPSYNLSTRKVMGLETLALWDHPLLGPTSLEQFYDIADQIGLLKDIDALSIDAALNMKTDLAQTAFHEVRVGFNISASGLRSNGFAKTLHSRVTGRGIMPAAIALEIPEQALFKNAAQRDVEMGIVAELNRYGFITMLDTFGAGTAGMRHLAQIGVTSLKIDQSLIKDLSAQSASRTVFQTLIDLCHQLDLYPVCDGVETFRQLKSIRNVGGVTIQGPLISDPLSRADILPFLKKTTDPNFLTDVP